MISTLEKEITLRFLKARKNDGFLNVISIFSFIGISLGVAVLIVVMSVMNGFRTELINKIVGFNSHITVKSYENSINLDKLNNNNLKLISLPTRQSFCDSENLSEQVIYVCFCVNCVFAYPLYQQLSDRVFIPPTRSSLGSHTKWF